MMNRAQIDAGANYIRPAGAGDVVMDQTQVVAIATAGNGVWTAAAMAAGIIDRSGPGAGYSDTPDTGDNILAAMPFLSAGDSFEFMVRNTVAFANTVAAASGVALSGANTAIAASKVRKYLMTAIAPKATQIIGNCATTNASPTVTGLTAAQVANLMPGMNVAGTGIPASTTLIAVNSSLGTVTLSANATATNNPVALTFTPNFTLKGLWSADL